MVSNFDLITIKCVAPHRILDWAERMLPNGTIIGEVTHSETVHYKTLDPKVGGLFCQQIFGAVKAKYCYCKIPTPRLLPKKTEKKVQQKFLQHSHYVKIILQKSIQLVYPDDEKFEEMFKSHDSFDFSTEEINVSSKLIKKIQFLIKKQVQKKFFYNIYFFDQSKKYTTVFFQKIFPFKFFNLNKKWNLQNLFENKKKKFKSISWYNQTKIKEKQIIFYKKSPFLKTYHSIFLTNSFYSKKDKTLIFAEKICISDLKKNILPWNFSKQFLIKKNKKLFEFLIQKKLLSLSSLKKINKKKYSKFRQIPRNTFYFNFLGHFQKFSTYNRFEISSPFQKNKKNTFTPVYSFFHLSFYSSAEARFSVFNYLGSQIQGLSFEKNQKKFERSGKEKKSWKEFLNPQQILSKILTHRLQITENFSTKFGFEYKPSIPSINILCPSCGVFHKSIQRRRYQLGYIDLLLYCSHIWFVKTRPSILSILLDLPTKFIHQIVYCQICLSSQPNYCIIQGDIWTLQSLKYLYGFIFGAFGFFDISAPWNKKEILFEFSLNNFGSLALYRIFKAFDIHEEMKYIENLFRKEIVYQENPSFENKSFLDNSRIRNIDLKESSLHYNLNKFLRTPLKNSIETQKIIHFDDTKKIFTFFQESYSFNQQYLKKKKTFYTSVPNNLSQIQDVKKKYLLSLRKNLHFPSSNDFFSYKKQFTQLKKTKKTGFNLNLLKEWVFLFDKKKKRLDSEILHKLKIEKIFGFSRISFLRKHELKKKIYLKKRSKQNHFFSYSLLNIWFIFYKLVRFSYNSQKYLAKLFKQIAPAREKTFDKFTFLYHDIYLFRFKWALYQSITKRRLISPLLHEQKIYLKNQLWIDHQYRLFRRYKILQRLNFHEFAISNLFLKFLPVLPPTLRPLLEMEDGCLVSSDLNELYLLLLRRQNRLAINLDTAESIPIRVIVTDYNLVQQGVDMIFENGRVSRFERRSYPVTRTLKSLTDFIQGKFGRFRHNLLGKRVDYSARSVIVVGPTLRLSQCGIPREIGLKLFYPFLLKYLLRNKHAINVFQAKQFLQSYVVREKKKNLYYSTFELQSLFTRWEKNSTYQTPLVKIPFITNKKEIKKKDIYPTLHSFWNLIQKIIGNHPVLLNRAPTLHRLGIQAFFPVLITGRSIQLHPLVCPSFNADFDGDQMGIHLPLSIQAQTEARLLMLASHHWFSPATGQPNLLPSQDMVLGFYYLTTPVELKTPLVFFKTSHEILMAYENNYCNIHTGVWLEWTGNYQNPEKRENISEIFLERSGKSYQISRYTFSSHDSYGNKKQNYIRTTPGRIFFHHLFVESL